MTKLQEDILKLHEEGKSYNQIVLILGCAKSTVSYYCGQDQRLKQVKRTRRNKRIFRDYVQKQKSGIPCMDCNVEYPYFVMEFDHRPNEEKLYTISKVNSIPSLEALKNEIAKCDLVCSNCHKFRTWDRLVKTGDAVLLDEDFL